MIQILKKASLDYLIIDRFLTLHLFQKNVERVGVKQLTDHL